MQTRLPQSFLDTPNGKMADSILRSCVHCGFCTATCPTYQLTGDELDSPRGRIYLIKQMLEDQPVSRHTQIHLDRCLTCRSCETTCPSGVEYGKLIDLGREWTEKKVSRPKVERSKRWLLRKILPYPKRYAWLIAVARFIRPVMPAKIRQAIPPRPSEGIIHRDTHARKMLMLSTCAQSVLQPNIDAAMQRVLGCFDIELAHAPASGCCGAIDQHLSAPDSARKQMQKNIDSWWPLLQHEFECIAINASGCGSHVKEYGHYFKDDVAYREKAEFISSKAKDLSEIMSTLPLEKINKTTNMPRIAFHSPCTLQHGLRITNQIEPLLSALGYDLMPVKDSHLCCGSAGTYSILQPDFSRQLLENKIQCLNEHKPGIIATANIGCLLHIQSQSSVPVKHWVELLDDLIG